MEEKTSEAEARKFCILLKQLDKERQNGLYLITKGMAVLAGKKKTILD